MSLHEMMSVQDRELLKFVPDYQLHLIDPARLNKTELEKFSTSLSAVLGYIKYSKNRKELSEFLKDHPHMEVEADAARVIKEITKTRLDIPKNAEVIDVCQAIEDMLTERAAESKAEGKLELLAELVQNGDLTLKRAAEKAGMSVEEFKKTVATIK